MAGKLSDVTDKQSIAQCVRRAVHQLEDARESDNPQRSSQAKADLSVLRRAVGRSVGTSPQAWSIVLERLGEGFIGTYGGLTDKETKAEQAGFDALTLYALHAQSARGSVFQAKQTIGHAMGSLCKSGGSASLKSRFDALLASSDYTTFLYHCRSIMSLLRSNGVAIDHGTLASALAAFQDPAKRDRVRLQWSRDFARIYTTSGNFEKGQQ